MDRQRRISEANERYSKSDKGAEDKEAYNEALRREAAMRDDEAEKPVRKKSKPDERYPVVEKSSSRKKIPESDSIHETMHQEGSKIGMMVEDDPEKHTGRSKELIEHVRKKRDEGKSTPLRGLDDRVGTPPSTRGRRPPRSQILGPRVRQRMERERTAQATPLSPVSYTHLTLPTKA
mgnify:CR=1 FL=1